MGCFVKMTFSYVHSVEVPALNICSVELHPFLACLELRSVTMFSTYAQSFAQHQVVVPL